MPAPYWHRSTGWKGGQSVFLEKGKCSIAFHSLKKLGGLEGRLISFSRARIFSHSARFSRTRQLTPRERWWQIVTDFGRLLGAFARLQQISFPFVCFCCCCWVVGVTAGKLIHANCKGILLRAKQGEAKGVLLQREAIVDTTIMQIGIELSTSPTSPLPYFGSGISRFPLDLCYTLQKKMGNGKGNSSAFFRFLERSLALRGLPSKPSPYVHTYTLRH